MLSVLLVFAATFSTEVAASLGKESVRKRRESVYDLVFLSLFWSFFFLLATLAFGASWRFSFDSLPTFIPRVMLEVLLSYVTAQAIIKADRTTSGFLRLLTIPMILVIDIALGYHLTSLQLGGIVLMFAALMLAFRHNKHGRRAAWLVVLNAIISVATLSLYKYDITHYNSVVAEQSIVVGVILVFFGIAAVRNGHRSPLKLLVRPVTGTQSLAYGLAVTVTSFAMLLAPASIIVTLQRTFSLMWSIIFGGAYFHEHSLRRKTASGVLMAVSVVLIASPLLFHL